MALYKRPNSKYWWMKFTFDGELVQASTKCKNKRDAEKVESGYRIQLALGNIGIEHRKQFPTFETAAEDFLAWSKIEHANKSNTHKRYYFDCRTLQNYFGKTKVNQIAPKDVEKFIVWRSGSISRKTKEPISRESINHEFSVLKMIFNRLLNAKILRDNPARLVKRLSEDEKKFHVITLDEEKQYLLASPQPLKDVAILMLETGMRCGEIYQLRRSEVFLDKSFLKVTRGKTKSSIRRVHLSEKAKAVLEYRLRKFAGKFLFPQNEIDHRPGTKTIDVIHRKIVTKLKFDFRLYDCRHTFATRAVEKGVDLLTLSSILGHSSLDMVTRYSHPSEERKAQAIRMMESAPENVRQKQSKF